MTDQPPHPERPREPVAVMPRTIAPDDPRIDVLLPELERRLRPVCATMPEEAFQAMLRDVARTRLRWG
jgi:hypothetical protein